MTLGYWHDGCRIIGVPFGRGPVRERDSSGDGGSTVLGNRRGM